MPVNVSGSVASTPKRKVRRTCPSARAMLTPMASPDAISFKPSPRTRLRTWPRWAPTARPRLTFVTGKRASQVRPEVPQAEEFRSHPDSRYWLGKLLAAQGQQVERVIHNHSGEQVGLLTHVAQRGWIDARMPVLLLPHDSQLHEPRRMPRRQ